MAKQKKEMDSPENPQANFTHTAYGLCKVNGVWNISMVQYDPNTLQAGEVTLKTTGDNFTALAHERFKIEIANNIFTLEK